MLVQLPRLTSTLREPFDVDQAYLLRKQILQNQNRRQLEVQNLLGHGTSDANMQKVASLAQRLSGMQLSSEVSTLVSERPVNGTIENAKFGADLVFRAPARFLVDVSLEDGDLLGEESTGLSSSYDEGLYSHIDWKDHHPASDGQIFNLSWLKG